MQLEHKQTKRIFFLGAVLTTGLLYFFSTGLQGFRFLVWIAPIPILIFSLNSSAKTATLAAFLAYFMGTLNLVFYLLRLGVVTLLGGGIVVFIIPAIVFALGVRCFRWAALEWNGWIAMLLFPAIWVSYEFLMSSVSPHGTFGNISYTQTDFTSLIQITSITGIWGISFLLFFFPAGIALAWHHRKKIKASLSFLLVTLLLPLMILAFGWWRTSQFFKVAPVRIGLVASDTMWKYFNAEKEVDAMKAVHIYNNSIGELTAQGASVILLPEKCIGITGEYEDQLLDSLKGSAEKYHTMIVIGINRIDSPLKRNEAVVISADGNILFTYDKRYFIPGFEAGYKRGNTIATFSLHEQKAGVAICKDMDFQNWIRQYGKAGTKIMIVPAWDFGDDGWLHCRMAVMRAAENGFALLRTAPEGMLTITDGFGKVISEKKSSDTPITLLNGSVIPGKGNTFYSRTGDWFAWLNVIFLGLMIALMLIRRRK